MHWEYCVSAQKISHKQALKLTAIAGFIGDSITQKKLDFITVNLLSEKGIPVKADYTKSDGSFSFSALHPLKYSVVFVGVGYKNKTVLVDLTDSTKQQSDLGIFFLRLKP